MKARTVVCLAAAALLCLQPNSSTAQISMSAGSYSQNFDSLGPTGTTWTNNATIAGWYASKASADATSLMVGTGSTATGGNYNFGVAGVSNASDRALGSLASAGNTYAFGVRFVNDTAAAVTNISASFSGEQWRVGDKTNIQALAFYYAVSSSPITNSFSAATWVSFATLNFNSPTTNAASSALDGNAATNRQVFSSVALAGVSVPSGQELFLRWQDVDDTGLDNGMAIDDLSVSFGTNGPAVTNPPSITTQPLSQSATIGDNVTFFITATGTAPLRYQWKFNTANLTGETNDSLTLTSVTTNSAGNYSVTVTNIAGATNSATATLTVNPPAPPVTNGTLSLLTYNMKGNGATNWSTNSLQVQAIGRQMQYLQPDIITFNETPFSLRYEMTNFVAAFLPGYSIVISSGSDSYICSSIATRFQITRSKSWLDSANLDPFGFTNSNFTRDLFEAEITVPGFPQHLHVFTTHLKATDSGTNYPISLAKRAAEAAAITNFLATNILALFPTHPYTLSGDMNESDTNELSIQRLISTPTGLILKNPTNPVTGSINTYSTATANPGERIDYIFPCALLSSNIASNIVFRTDKLNPVPPTLNSNDDKVASDHLPVMMVFNNPYAKPFRLLSVTRTSPSVTLRWESVVGQTFAVLGSSNLTTWATLASNLLATNSSYTFTTNSTPTTRFFRVLRP